MLPMPIDPPGSGLGKVRYIVCCLPFVSLPKEVSETFLQRDRKFMDEGLHFRIFQYAHGYYSAAGDQAPRISANRYGKSTQKPADPQECSARLYAYLVNEPSVKVSIISTILKLLFVCLPWYKITNLVKIFHSNFRRNN